MYACKIIKGYLFCYYTLRVVLINMLSRKLEHMFGYYLSTFALEINYTAIPFQTASPCFYGKIKFS